VSVWLEDADPKRWQRPLHGLVARDDGLTSKGLEHGCFTSRVACIPPYPGTVVTAKIPAMTLIEPD